jgi:hypothetical protein
MRASNCFHLSAACLTLLLAAAGCSKEVKADFPRPPATATLPPPPEEPVALPEVPAPEEPVATEPVEELLEGEDELEEPPEAPPPIRERVIPAEEEAPAEPLSTTLSGSAEVDPELASKLERARSLLRSISRRNLTSVQADQLVAARGFVTQARQALAEGDPRRALVLIDKGLILAEDVDRLSRP